YGSVSAIISDSTGAVVPGASVTVTSVERKTSDTVVTNESGSYVKERLLPGKYEVKAELQGFKTAVFPDINVSVDTQTKLNVKLDLGQVSENVTVAGFSPVLKTDRADVATTFDTKQINDLPVLDRNFTKFIPDTTRNQFGGALGGPIQKDKIFIFGDYSGLRSKVGGSQLLTVPTAAARNGDLGAYGVNIFDPLSGATPAQRAQFASNVIPHGR